VNSLKLTGYLLLCLWMLTACTELPWYAGRAEAVAHEAGFTKQTVNTGQFIITTYHKISGKNTDTLTVYIEGDGLAFRRENRISTDPTPRKPVALELAARDNSPALLYITRPCQYLTRDLLDHCDPRYWSTHRYAEEVIAAINSVINQYASSYSKIRLVGYSGGGSVAVLLAARRRDIAWLVTIGANLDHVLWTALHNVSPLSGSLNPADYAESIQGITQLHLSGSEDETVPVSVLQSYLEPVTEQGNIYLKTIPGYDHQCCWSDIWPQPMCEIESLYCLK
jgi:hypothetical protein